MKKKATKPVHAQRFQDKKLRISDVYNEVWVHCPACDEKAIAKVDEETLLAKLVCTKCSYAKQQSLVMQVMPRATGIVRMAAHGYFGAGLWLQHRFKQHVVWAYNLQHLEYLEQYIAARLREHKDRTHYTLLEKLPIFYHDAKNRDALLKIIERLKHK